MYEAKIPVAATIAPAVLGIRDKNLQRLRETFAVRTSYRDGQVALSAESEDVLRQATAVVEKLKAMADHRQEFTDEAVQSVFRPAAVVPDADAMAFTQTSRLVKPRTPGQAAYVRAIRDNEIVFAIGPAGTGKTYLAVAAAVEALKRRQIRKIVLVRPAVEAGESLGFLPGDLQAKINPYLRPLLDALYQMMDFEEIRRAMEQDIIEVIPLAYMRGRTLSEAFIILDEGQNTTVPQMKMFLTRMGEGSRIVISGDPTQVDLPPSTRSGLIDALGRLTGIKGIGTVRLTGQDIVRHRLVQDIVRAYDDRPATTEDRPEGPAPEADDPGRHDAVGGV